MLRIAITGGIGSGKTAATNYLRKLGHVVIDADEMSRAMTAAGGKAIPYIREKFGDDFILSDGSLDRKKMRDLVFSDSASLELLEEGTTKVVEQDIENELKHLESEGYRFAFVAIPLLFETDSQSGFDEVWLVYANREVRVSRIKSRDGHSEEMIDRIMNSQFSDEVKLALSDVVINNSGSLEELYEQIDRELSRLNSFE